MCHRVVCRTCGKPTWAGCGQHIEEVLHDVPVALGILLRHFLEQALLPLAVQYAVVVPHVLGQGLI